MSRLLHRQMLASNALPMLKQDFGKLVKDIRENILFVMTDLQVLFKSTQVAFGTNQNIIEEERLSTEFGFLACEKELPTRYWIQGN